MAERERAERERERESERERERERERDCLDLIIVFHNLLNYMQFYGSNLYVQLFISVTFLNECG